MLPGVNDKRNLRVVVTVFKVDSHNVLMQHKVHATQCNIIHISFFVMYASLSYNAMQELETSLTFPATCKEMDNQECGLKYCGMGTSHW